jgi:hypothetical protein
MASCVAACEMGMGFKRGRLWRSSPGRCTKCSGTWREGPGRGLHLDAQVLGEHSHDAFPDLWNTKFQGVVEGNPWRAVPPTAHSKRWAVGVSQSSTHALARSSLPVRNSARTWRKRHCPASSTNFLRESTSSARAVFRQGAALCSCPGCRATFCQDTKRRPLIRGDSQHRLPLG